MTDDLRPAIRTLSVVLHAVIEQAYHAHYLAEQAYDAAVGHAPADGGHILRSKTEVLRLLDEAVLKLDQ